MTSNFAESLSGWHDFYLLAGGASATLIGLLFVGVSIHIDLIAHEKAVPLRHMAGQILFNFIYVIVIALSIVNPIVTSTFLGIVVLIVGTTGFLRLIIRAFGVMRIVRNWFTEEVKNPINVLG